MLGAPTRWAWTALWTEMHTGERFRYLRRCHFVIDSIPVNIDIVRAIDYSVFIAARSKIATNIWDHFFAKPIYSSSLKYNGDEDIFGSLLF